MEAKRNAWRSITDSLTSMYTNHVRQWANVKKRYSNIKQSGNTGPVIVLKPEETEYLNGNDGAPSIDGIAGGMETIIIEEEIEVADDIALLLQQVEKPIIETPIQPTATKKENARSPNKTDYGIWM